MRSSYEFTRKEKETISDALSHLYWLIGHRHEYEFLIDQAIREAKADKLTLWEARSLVLRQWYGAYKKASKQKVGDLATLTPWARNAMICACAFKSDEKRWGPKNPKRTAETLAKLRKANAAFDASYRRYWDAKRGK